MRCVQIHRLVGCFFAAFLTGAATAQSAGPALVPLGSSTLPCIAFNKDGSCAALASSPSTFLGTPLGTPVGINGAVAGASGSAQSVQVIRPNAVSLTPISVGQVPGGFAPITIEDYMTATFASARFQSGGMNYGNRKTAYSIKGWNVGFETGRSALFALGRIGHYREDNTFNYAPGALTLYRVDGGGSLTNTVDTVMTTENVYNIYEGAVGVRRGIDQGLSANVSLYGRRDEATNLVATTETGSAAYTGATTSLRENIKSTYIGVRLGAALVQPVAPQFRLRASAGVAPVHVDHQYDATQNINSLVITSNQSLKGWGYIADARAALEYHNNGNMALSVGAFGNYVSKGPSIDRPDSADTSAVIISSGDIYDTGATLGLSLGF